MSTNLNYIVFRFRNIESNTLTCFISISHDYTVAVVEGSIGRKHPNKEILENLITSSKPRESITSFISLFSMFYIPGRPLCNVPENIVKYKKE